MSSNNVIAGIVFATALGFVISLPAPQRGADKNSISYMCYPKKPLL